MIPIFPIDIIKDSSETFFAGQNRTGRLIYLTIVVSLIVTFAMLPFIRVGITTQSQGIIRSKSENNPLYLTIQGKVLLSNLRNNQNVVKDEILMVVSSTHLQEEIVLADLQLFNEKELLNDLNLLLKGDSTGYKTALYQQDYATLSGSLAEQNTHVKSAMENFTVANRLFDKGITPKHDLNEVFAQYESEKLRLSAIRNQHEAGWQMKKREAEHAVEQLKTKRAQFVLQEKDYTLRSPIAGTITDYSGIKEGNYISPNQLIAKISPNNDLVVECFVTPTDIGLIHVNMTATFQLHAFNYNLWGLASGEVTEISGNVITVNNLPFFQVICKLNQNFLQLKNGYKGYFIKGMTMTGRFNLADRTLFQLLYDKIDNWVNPQLKGQ